MAQLFVPDKVHLVCSEGLISQQLSVTSQYSSRMSGGLSIATSLDRMGENFNCAKMIVAGAIAGAIVGSIIATATIATGGLAGAAIVGCIGAGSAVLGAGVGSVFGFIPCICGCLTKEWYPIHPQIRIKGLYPILENSTIGCYLGGVVSIYYSAKAASAAIEYTQWDTGLKVFEAMLGGFLGGFLGNIICGSSGYAIKFTKEVIANAIIRAFPVALANTALGYGINVTKSVLYSQMGWNETVNMGDVDTFQIKENLLNKDSSTSNNQGTVGADDYASRLLQNVGEGMNDVIEKNSRSYEHRTTTEHIMLGDMSESKSMSSSNISEGSIVEKRPQVTSSRTLKEYQIYDRKHIYIEAEDVRTESGIAYNKRNISDDLKRIVKDKKFRKDTFANMGRGLAGSLIESLCTDAVMAGLNNSILKSLLNNLREGLIDEEIERNKHIVQEEDI